MPWVKPVAPEEMKSLVSVVVPGAEVVVFSSPSRQSTSVRGDASGEEESDIVRALAWAAEGENGTELGRNSLSLVVIAGSLYLIADLYRELMKSGEILPYLSESV